MTYRKTWSQWHQTYSTCSWSAEHVQWCQNLVVSWSFQAGFSCSNSVTCTFAMWSSTLLPDENHQNDDIDCKSCICSRIDLRNRPWNSVPLSFVTWGCWSFTCSNTTCKKDHTVVLCSCTSLITQKRSWYPFLFSICYCESDCPGIKFF